MPISVNIAGTWKAATPFVNVGGVWKAAPAAMVNVAGVWNTAAAQKVATPSVSNYVPNGSTATFTFTCTTSGAAIQTSTDGGSSWITQSSISVAIPTLALRVRATKSGWITSDIVIIA